MAKWTYNKSTFLHYSKLIYTYVFQAQMIFIFFYKFSKKIVSNLPQKNQHFLVILAYLIFPSITLQASFFSSHVFLNSLARHNYPNVFVVLLSIKYNTLFCLCSPYLVCRTLASLFVLSCPLFSYWCFLVLLSFCTILCLFWHFSHRPSCCSSQSLCGAFRLPFSCPCSSRPERERTLISLGIVNGLLL